MGAAGVPKISGICDQRFASVRDALEDNFRERGELGAAVAITLEGKPVVDMWAGWTDRRRTRPWQRDTLVAVFSVGKAMVALCILALVERGQLDLEAPVARYWPEFAARGKDHVSLRMLLAHRAGLPAVRRRLPDHAMYDWDLMTGTLAAEEPWWEPDSMHGYHVNTFGFLVGEIVRRVTGRTIGKFFQTEVASRLDADFQFGVASKHDGRVAEYVFAEQSPEIVEEEMQKNVPQDDEERRFLLGRVYLNPPGVSGIGTVNTRAWRAAEIPSANGHATAAGVARIYSALASGGIIDGIRLLRPQTIDEAIAPASEGIDFVLGRPSRFGLGFQLTQAERPLGPNPRSFGHFGAGGSLGFADPEAGLAFAYALNQSGPRWQNPRNRALLEAVYESV